MNPSTVYVIDDDPDITKSLRWLIESVGYSVKTFSNAKTFLDSYNNEPGCVIADVRMPELTGLGLQEQLRSENLTVPIIFTTAHGDVPMAVRAMKNGAIDFLTKPVNNQVLLETINKAIAVDGQIRQKKTISSETHKLAKQLTPRETQVMRLMVTGKTTKEIAAVLEISPNTVELHRAKVLKKMQAKTIANLVYMALKHELVTDD